MEKRIWKLTVCLVSAALVLSVLSLPALAAEKGKKAPESTTISGTVVEMGKTSKGQPTYGIKTEKGDYLVTGKKSADLAKLVGKKVEATGTVTASKDKNSIAVAGFKALEAAPPAPAPAAPAPAPVKK